MNTVEALKESVKKWENIVYNKGYDMGISDCSLCQKFYYIKIGKPVCTDCPVFIATGKPVCEGSPYEEWARAFVCEYLESTRELLENKFPKYIIGPKTKKAAMKELEFLQQLLRDYNTAES